MINAIVNGIFSLIINLFNTLLSPIISAITVLFPDINTYFSYINTFLNYSLTYVSTILDLFLIPRSALVLLFDYFIICYSIHLLSSSIKFGITIYNKFKL